MTRDYFTEDAKLAKLKNTEWTINDCEIMHNLMNKKGYFINCVYRRGCDMKYHNAWEVERKDVPRLVEQLFRQRLVAEFQAEGHGKASINFVYDYHPSTIIDAIHRFWKNK